MKKTIIFIFLFVCLAKSQPFVTLFESLTEDQTLTEFNNQGWNINVGNIRTDCGGVLAEFFPQGESLEINLTVPEHTKLQISYNLACQFSSDGETTFNLIVDGETVDSQSPQGPNDLITIRNCNFEENLIDNLNNSVVLDHTDGEVTIRFENTVNTNINSCILYDIKVEYQPFVDPQVCFDNINELMDDEGNLLIQNSCDTVSDGEVFSFDFTTMFMEPFQLNEDCFTIEVWFNETLLQQGDGEFNQWTFDGETQKVQWSIQLSDFTDLYNCMDGENQDQLFWLCPFSTKLIFDGEVQVEYKAKIQVVVDRLLTDSIEVDVQKNVVEGICCENELLVTTVLNFCDSLACDNYLPSPLTIERKEDFFVEMMIMNPEFQAYYLKILEVTLGEFFPVVVKYDSSVVGKLRLQLRSNIAKNNLILQVIAQLHKDPVLPSMGGSGRRVLQSVDVGDAYERLEKNEYKISALEQISVVNELEEIEKYDSQYNNNNNNFNDGMEKGEVYEEEESGFPLVLIVVVASFGIVSIVAGLSIHFLKNRKEERQKKENLYLDSQEAELQSV